jgi:hypothetical protein
MLLIIMMMHIMFSQWRHTNQRLKEPACSQCNAIG